MPQNFIALDREQAFLLAPDVPDWLPEGHLAWFVLDAVAQMDLSAFCAAYTPAWSNVGVIAVDGTKLHANASDRANLTGSRSEALRFFGGLLWGERSLGKWPLVQIAFPLRRVVGRRGDRVELRE